MKKNIILVNVPYTLVSIALCPLEQVALETLRFITMMRTNGSEIRFVNLRSKEKFLWKRRNAGRSSEKTLQMQIASKTQRFFIHHLKEASPYLDAIYIICNFSFSPYLYDKEVVESIVSMSRHYANQAEVKIGGQFINIFPEFAADLNLETFPFDTDEIKHWKPSLAALRDEGYGLFQLTKGCINKCAFCIAGNEQPESFDVQEAIADIVKTHDEFGIEEFWNWDQNVLLYPDKLIDFFQKISDLQHEITLHFALGFQPDLVTEALIQAIRQVKVGILTIPFETGTAENFRRINKPYTIIEAIQTLYKINRYAGHVIKRIQSSFVIGYPDDDFQAIFRVYLSILRLNAIPVVFPVYVFPGTKVYRENQDLLQHKSITEQHGQLWPLVQDDQVEAYQNVLRFLLIGNLEEARKRTDLLTDEMQEIFWEELKINEYFVEMCLQAENGGYESLRSIESRLQAFRSRKENLLYISASPQKTEKSVSKLLGEYFCREYEEHNSGVKRVVLDLSQEPLDFVSEEYVDFIGGEIAYPELTEKTKKMVQLVDQYIQLFRYADKIILATPMYTLSIPAVLKAFFELIASKLFYELKDKVEPKKVCCIISRDGAYRPEDKYNVQENTIEAILKFIGIGSDIQFILAENMYRKDRRAEKIEAVKEEIRKVVQNF